MSKIKSAEISKGEKTSKKEKMEGRMEIVRQRLGYKEAGRRKGTQH